MALDELKIGGMGASRRRVEDNRFIRGKGNYIDDVVLPAMLHMEILRSPVAHARIKSIDTSAAWEVPGVRLVLTGETMAARNLAWMPTLSYDTQAVIATDKVRFQGQEVAAVVADDPYIAKDACSKIVVEYEQLPAIVNPDQAKDSSAPLIRDDKVNQDSNKIFDWEIGDKRGYGQGLRRGGRRVESGSALSALAPIAAGAVRLDRGLRPRNGQADRVHDHAGPAHHSGGGGHGGGVAGASDQDHQPRPRRRFRQQGPGVPRLRHFDPGVDPHRTSGQMDRGQVRQLDLDRIRTRRLLEGGDGASQRTGRSSECGCTPRPIMGPSSPMPSRPSSRSA